MGIFETPDDYGLDPDKWNDPHDMDGTKVIGDKENEPCLSPADRRIAWLKKTGLYEKYGPLHTDETGNPVFDPTEPWWMQFKSPFHQEENE